MAKSKSPKQQTPPHPAKTSKRKKATPAGEAVQTPAATELQPTPETSSATEAPPEVVVAPAAPTPPAELTAPQDAQPQAANPPIEQPAEPTAPAQPKKLSALDAAAKVLAESAEAMTTQAMIEAMAAKGYWSSPGGQTPAATLYSAVLREITTKGEQSRFVKTERGKFALKANA